MHCHVTRPTPSSKTRTRHGLGAKQTFITRTITPKVCRATQFFRPLLQFTTAAHSCIRCVAPRTNAATEVGMMSHSDRSLTHFRGLPLLQFTNIPPSRHFIVTNTCLPDTQIFHQREEVPIAHEHLDRDWYRHGSSYHKFSGNVATAVAAKT